MRNEKQSVSGKSQTPYGRRRRSHKSRSSNTDSTHKSSVLPTTTENIVLKLDKNSVRFARSIDEKFSSIRDKQTIKVFNSIFNTGNSLKLSKKDKVQRIEAKETPVKKASDSKENDQSAKGAINKTDRPIPARPSNPLRFKTELCRAHEEGGHCRFGVACTFAHGQEELRSIPRHHKYKTEQCRSYHSIGYCQYGTRCHFIHDAEDIATVVPFVKPDFQGNYEYFGPSMNNLLESIGLSYKSLLDETLKLESYTDLENAALENPEKCVRIVQSLDEDMEFEKYNEFEDAALENTGQCKRFVHSPRKSIDNSALKRSLSYMELFFPSPPLKTKEASIDLSKSPPLVKQDICKNLFSRTPTEILGSSLDEILLAKTPFAESPKYSLGFPCTSIYEDPLKFNELPGSSPPKSRLNLTTKVDEEADSPLFHTPVLNWERNFDLNPWRSVSAVGLSGKSDTSLSRDSWWKSLGSRTVLKSKKSSPAKYHVPSDSGYPVCQARATMDRKLKTAEILSSAIAESVISEPPELTWDLRLPMIEEFYPKCIS